jgi:hypothetical protein
LPDWLIVGYMAVRFGLTIERSEFSTQWLRFAMVLMLDVAIPYFVFSRAITSIGDFRKVFLALVVSVLPLALIGVFETAKGWLLYSWITISWADYQLIGYGFQRAGLLRATASAGTPIVLGFVILVGMGCLLSLRQAISSRFAVIAFAVFAAGVLATVSRGPWVGAMVLIFAYLATSPRAPSDFLKFALVGAIMLLPLMVTPLGSELINLLPFIGSAETGSVTYRSLLFDHAMLVIERNPWFGLPIGVPEMLRCAKWRNFSKAAHRLYRFCQPLERLRAGINTAGGKMGGTPDVAARAAARLPRFV